MSREEKFRRKGKAKSRTLNQRIMKTAIMLTNSEKSKTGKRAKEIRAQEREVIRRRKNL